MGIWLGEEVWVVGKKRTQAPVNNAECCWVVVSGACEGTTDDAIGSAFTFKGMGACDATGSAFAFKGTATF